MSKIIPGLSEYDIHIQIIRWLMVKAIQCPWAKEFFHVPNGGHRHIKEAMRLKNMGVKPGVFDLVHPAMIAVEIKRPGGKLSKEQVAWKESAEKWGWKCLVVESLEEFIAGVEKFFCVIV